MCRLYGFIGGLTGTASIATLTAISIDRYNVGKNKKTKTRKTKENLNLQLYERSALKLK